MRAWFHVAILMHLLSAGVVEPRIRQASSSMNTGSSVPQKVPKIMRRRKSNAELIRIPSNGGSISDGGSLGGSSYSGLMTTLENHPSHLNLEGLNNAVRKNQINLVAQAPKLDMFMKKNRHEQPSLVQRVNERNKKVGIEEMTHPEAIFRIFSLSMSFIEEGKEADLSDYQLIPRKFSMSMSMTRSSAETDLARAEERDFFRSGSVSMTYSALEARDIELIQMSSMSMSVVAEERSALDGLKLPIRPRSGINFYQMIDMSMPSKPSAPIAPSTPSAPSSPSAPIVPTPGTTPSPASVPSNPLPPGTTATPSISTPSEPTMVPIDSGNGLPTVAPEPSSNRSPSETGGPPSMPDRTLSPTIEGSNEFPSGSGNGYGAVSWILSATTILYTILVVIPS